VIHIFIENKHLILFDKKRKKELKIKKIKCNFAFTKKECEFYFYNKKKFRGYAIGYDNALVRTTQII